MEYQRLTICLTKNEEKAVRRAAQIAGKSISSYIREAIDYYREACETPIRLIEPVEVEYAQR